MKVRNMVSAKGNPVANQFVITLDQPLKTIQIFQSYGSTIVKEVLTPGKRIVELDEKYWNYSKTTGKYRKMFLGETKAETQRKIDSGEYQLVDLNG